MANSISRLYGGASLIGVTRKIDIPAVDTQVVIQLVDVSTVGAPFSPAVFIFAALTASGTYVLRQGNVDGPAVNEAVDFRMTGVQFWRIDVTDPQNAVLRIISPDTSGNDVARLTRIDSLSAVGSP